MKNVTLKTGLFSLLLAIASSALCFAQDKKERHIFLLIGQSNMAGRAKIESVDKQPIERAQLWQISEKKWLPAAPPFNLYSPARKDIKMQRLNCGPSFAKTYAKSHPNIEVGIICAARGGTKIDQWNREKPDKYKLYKHAIDAAKAALAEGGELKGILWHQGEGDSGNGVASYPKKLAELVGNLREDLNAPELPFVFAQLGQWKENYAAFNQMIVKQPAAISSTACVTTEDITHFDKTHFDSASQRELGKRYASAIEKLLAKK